MSETPLQDEEKHTFGIVAACEKRRESDMLRSSETLVNVLSVRSVKFWTAFTWIYLFRLFPAQAWKTEGKKKKFAGMGMTDDLSQTSSEDIDKKGIFLWRQKLTC